MTPVSINRLSIIIPAYNEAGTVESVLYKTTTALLPAGIEKEIIIVNDFSNDDTENVVLKYIQDHPELDVHYIKQPANKGKGAAIQAGIQIATGDYLVIQDADLEYDPDEYVVLLKPVLKGMADVVYGTRFIGGNPHRVLFFWHSIGNKLLTFLSNMFTNLNLTDMETGFKLFNTKMIQQLKLKEKRFGFEPEVTAKIAKVPGIRIYEVGISYYGRTFREGKKINWRDGFHALYCVLKYNTWGK